MNEIISLFGFAPHKGIRPQADVARPPFASLRGPTIGRSLNSGSPEECSKSMLLF